MAEQILDKMKRGEGTPPENPEQFDLLMAQREKPPEAQIIQLRRMLDTADRLYGGGEPERVSAIENKLKQLESAKLQAARGGPVSAPQQPETSPQKPTAAPESEHEQFLSVEERDPGDLKKTVQTLQDSRTDLRKQQADLDKKIKELEKVVTYQTGPRYKRGQIKASAPKGPLKEYQELRAKWSQLGQSAATIEEQIRQRGQPVEIHKLQQRVNNAKLPLLTRLMHAGNFTLPKGKSPRMIWVLPFVPKPTALPGNITRTPRKKNCAKLKPRFNARLRATRTLPTLSSWTRN